MNLISGVCGGLIGLNLMTSGAEQKWTIHEWGTFTSLQNERGISVGGINTDDEPVPSFVYQFSRMLPTSETPMLFFKGVPNCDRDVTMRMETPVIYFHPPKTAAGTTSTVDVNVRFNGGWLSEFYPKAELTGMDRDTNGAPRFGPLRSDSITGLTWAGLKVGGDWPMIETSEHVWTSPRAVDAAEVQTAEKEAERFLFYRGVAHIDAPIRVVRNRDELYLYSNLFENEKRFGIQNLWLVDIRRDGKIAFRTLPPTTFYPYLKPDAADKATRHTAATFPDNEFSTDNLDKLKASLKAALIADGLYDDEAQALLNTWQVSYFKSPGLRLFFLVPREWTDHYLPLSVSVPADVNRVMVGRIELVTPEQRERLRTLSNLTPAQIAADRDQLATNYMAGALRAQHDGKVDEQAVSKWIQQVED